VKESKEGANSKANAVFVVPGVGCFDSKKAQGGLEFAKEPDLVEKWIKPAIRDAVVHLKWFSVVDLMMSWLKDQAHALQPAYYPGWLFLMRPLVKDVGTYCCGCH
jgi:hypothetical protein